MRSPTRITQVVTRLGSTRVTLAVLTGISALYLGLVAFTPALQKSSSPRSA